MACGALAVREAESRRPHSRELLRICGLAAVTALFERDPRRVEALFFQDKVKRAGGPEQALLWDASYRIGEGGLEPLDLHRALLRAALFEMRPAYRVIGTALGHGQMPGRLESGLPVALVFGNEEPGLDPATIAACDQIWSIPGSSRVQSLNLAARAAVLLEQLPRP